MKLVKASYEIMSTVDREEILKGIEIAGRTCYKSEDKITEDSASRFVNMITDRGHMSVIEHKNMTVKFICDRGVTHEIVRHRIASFSQESTRYCNYSKDKFGNQLTFIIPCWFAGSSQKEIEKENGGAVWISQISDTEVDYNTLISDHGWTPQQARSILPNSLKTEIVVTANLRAWREIFRQRCSPAAHPQMREVMIPLQKEMREILPEIFDYNT